MLLWFSSGVRWMPCQIFILVLFTLFTLMLSSLSSLSLVLCLFFQCLLVSSVYLTSYYLSWLGLSLFLMFVGGIVVSFSYLTMLSSDQMVSFASISLLLIIFYVWFSLLSPFWISLVVTGALGSPSKLLWGYGSALGYYGSFVFLCLILYLLIILIVVDTSISNPSSCRV